MSAIDRQHEHAKPLTEQADSEAEPEESVARQRFSTAGPVPPVHAGFGTPARTASEVAFGPDEAQRRQGGEAHNAPAATDRVGRTAAAASAMLAIWESNTTIAKNTIESFVHAKAPPAAPALAKAILSIGIEAVTTRFFGHLIESTTDGEEKAFFDIAQAASKQGLSGLADTLGGGGGLRVAPGEFARTWQNAQLTAINNARGALVDVLDDTRANDSHRLRVIDRIRSAAPTSQAMTQVLLQQYSHALYYESGDPDYDAPGLVEISINVGRGPGNLSDVDEKGALKTATASIAGLDTSALARMSSALAPGVDPVAMRMPFRIRIWETTDEAASDREGEGRSSTRARDLYFNNGGVLQNFDREALDLIYRFGGRIPIVGSFGSRQAVVGWTRAVL